MLCIPWQSTVLHLTTKSSAEKTVLHLTTKDWSEKTCLHLTTKSSSKNGKDSLTTLLLWIGCFSTGRQQQHGTPSNYFNLPPSPMTFSMRWFDLLLLRHLNIELEYLSFTFDMFTNVNLSVYFSLSHINGFGTLTQFSRSHTDKGASYQILVVYGKSCYSKAANRQTGKGTDKQIDRSRIPI